MTEAFAPGIRPPGVAGLFYPASPDQLTEVVGTYLGPGGPPGTRPRALVAPHAGYDYSGATAGRAFAPAAGEWDTVVLVGPSHLEAFHGVSLYPGQGYRTPLGTCAIDTELAAGIVEGAGGVVRSAFSGHWIEGGRRQEHALEVELPFLQLLGEQPPAIVPLTMGEQSWATVEALGRAITAAVAARARPERVLLVASSDLSHFHSDSQAEELDGRTLELVAGFDPRALHEGLRSGQAEACGGGPIAAVMLAAAALGATRAAVVDYTHSGRITGDHHSVVGYGAVRFDA
jgi:AmmeMemoRadiSam system protein B